MSEPQEPEDRGDEVSDIDAEPTPAAPESEAPAAPEPDPPKPDMVPHARFEELNQQLKLEREDRRALEARLNDFMARQHEPKPEPPPAFDLAAANKAYMEAVVEGKHDDAARVLSSILDDQRKRVEAEVSTRTRREIESAQIQQAVEAVAEKAAAEYPFLDSTKPDANQAAIQEVVEWRDYYIIAKKMTPAKALHEAVRKIAPSYVKPPAEGIAAGTDRALEQRQANAKAAAQQPPDLTGIGERAARTVKPDVGKMTDAEFEALPENERARLRGDVAA